MGTPEATMGKMWRISVAGAAMLLLGAGAVLSLSCRPALSIDARRTELRAGEVAALTARLTRHRRDQDLEYVWRADLGACTPQRGASEVTYTAPRSSAEPAGDRIDTVQCCVTRGKTIIAQAVVRVRIKGSPAPQPAPPLPPPPPPAPLGPTIEITSVPVSVPQGSKTMRVRIAGAVRGSCPDTAYLCIYSITDQAWIQPFQNNPRTDLLSGGRFSVDVHPGTDYVVLLVDGARRSEESLPRVCAQSAIPEVDGEGILASARVTGLISAPRAR